MNETFKALSLLLTYPTAELQGAVGGIESALRREALVPARALARLDRLLGDLKTLDLYELQERYVFLFDRTRSLSLHLFEHVHGESRDRGQAMADLKALYAAHGLEIDARELPDYLPLFLEFLSQRPVAQARGLLAETAAVIAALKERLVRRRSVYAAVFGALEAISDARANEKELDALRRAPDEDADDLEALDRAWEDAPVTFGPGAESCPSAERMLKRMSAPDGAARGRGA